MFFLFIFYIIILIPTFDVNKLEISKKTDQIMIVIPDNYTSYTATFYYYKKLEIYEKK